MQRRAYFLFFCIAGLIAFHSLANAESLIKTKLLIKSLQSNGSIAESHMEFTSSTSEEANLVVKHFASQVNIPPADPDDDVIVSVAKYQTETGSYQIISGR